MRSGTTGFSISSIEALAALQHRKACRRHLNRGLNDFVPQRPDLRSHKTQCKQHGPNQALNPRWERLPLLDRKCCTEHLNGAAAFVTAPFLQPTPSLQKPLSSTPAIIECRLLL